MNEDPTRRTVVVVEDDPDIQSLLGTTLASAGFDVIPVGNGLDGVRAVRAYNPILVTVDVSMPGIDGIETTRRIREFSDAYIVMLTALGEEIDVLQGLDAGADDYLTKPFRPRELRARIEAMLRRPRDGGDAPAEATAPTEAPAGSERATGAPATGAVAEETPTEAAAAPLVADGAPPAAVGGEGWLEHRGLRLHPERYRTEVDGRQVELTKSEFDLLRAILESGQRVRSKTDLALILRGEDYVTDYFVADADRRIVEVHVGNLRRKIGDNSTSPHYIETVRGVGYRLTGD